jgi:hypothetical protein
MIGSRDNDYYRRRAEQAERLAAAASSPEVQQIHNVMATRYRSLADAQRPTLKLGY